MIQKKVEKMPPPEVFKFLDIREAYLLAPGFWDPLIFTIFLYYVLLYSFKSAKHIRKRGWEGGLGEDRAEVKRIERA
ncbi:MAG: hypothetical protein ACRENF_06250, partial [Thermodesulfobacteriota bacterium]